MLFRLMSSASCAYLLIGCVTTQEEGRAVIPQSDFELIYNNNIEIERSLDFATTTLDLDENVDEPKNIFENFEQAFYKWQLPKEILNHYKILAQDSEQSLRIYVTDVEVALADPKRYHEGDTLDPELAFHDHNCAMRVAIEVYDGERLLAQQEMQTVFQNAYAFTKDPETQNLIVYSGKIDYGKDDCRDNPKLLSQYFLKNVESALLGVEAPVGDQAALAH